MNRSHLLALPALLFVFAAPALYARIERSVVQTFTAQPGGALAVSTQGGDIDVVVGSDDQVKVVARLIFPKADTEAEADAIMKATDLAITQSGRTVSAIVRTERSRFSFPWKNNSVAVHVTVTVPAQFEADLKTSGGDIRVARLGGKLAARTSGGDVVLGHIDGEVDASTSGGDITLDEGTASARLETSGGDIEVKQIKGIARLSTSGGDIEINQAASSVQASTSGGDVSVTFTNAIREDCVLRSSGGDIVAQVRPDAGFQLDAGTSGGGIKADGLSIRLEQGGLGKSRLSGTVNGGGSLLKLRTSGGDIRIAQK